MHIPEKEKAELEVILKKLRETLEKPDGQKKLSKAIFEMVIQPTREKSA